MSTIAKRRAEILARIEKSARGTLNGALPELVAVSKVQPDARIADMLAAGQRVFGENRVQEAQARWGARFAGQRSALSLHLIGPLQTNKAIDAAALFDVIETLDREKLARSIAAAGQKIGRLPRLLVQVNTGEEPQKAGIVPRDLDRFLAVIKKDYDLTPEGLMCIPPVEEAASAHFILLRTLAARHGLTTLSMGMSADFETACALGATHVRVGSALFGERDAALLEA